MIIAWVGSASVGIFMARYMKVAFGKRELLGTKVWFTVRYDVNLSNIGGGGGGNFLSVIFNEGLF